ncbi:hypothetical protein TUMEXPCC7403_08775 [Tumidithrix helvetica PCC 7403]|uniref:outer membrane protein assembly factor BamE domain-containing protein n=1 Tax=Tumidithrix helvetica TaxID=3457545 RepID=UPI003C98DF93
MRGLQAIGAVSAIAFLTALTQTVPVTRVHADITTATSYSSQFDSTVWKDLERINKEPYPRLAMADELVRTRRLDGLTRQQVLTLLGDPTSTNYFKGQYDIIYWLGRERSYISIDSEWLVIKFDTKGIVQKYAIVRD